VGCNKPQISPHEKSKPFDMAGGDLGWRSIFLRNEQQDVMTPFIIADHMVLYQAGIGTFRVKVAGRSQGRDPRATLHDFTDLSFSQPRSAVKINF
jgi:hypothetical protein